MKIRHAMILLLTVAMPAYATEQWPDFLILNGVLYELPVSSYPSGDLPLESLWNNPRAELGLSLMSTGCWRGYTAVWEIKDDSLYLRALDAWRDHKKVGLKDIFPERFKDGRVKADWFSGDLSLTADELSWLFAIFREENTPPEFYEITLQVKNGNLRSVKRHNPPDPNQSHGPRPLAE